MSQDNTNGRKWKPTDPMTPLCFLIASGSAVFFGFCGWQLSQLFAYFALLGATNEMGVGFLIDFYHFVGYIVTLAFGAFGLSVGFLVASRVLPANHIDESPDQDDSPPI